MKVKILREAGFYEAMLGLSLSHGTTTDRAYEVSKKLSFKGFGHNKVLEAMLLWIDVTAPRYVWQEMDTYRISTKQSQATMHTILKREFTQDDFEEKIPDTWLDDLNFLIRAKDLRRVKQLLPESFLQRRIWVMSYKTLQNIYIQRHNHKLPEWRYFCEEVLKQIEHPYYVKQEEAAGVRGVTPDRVFIDELNNGWDKVQKVFEGLFPGITDKGTDK